MASHASTPGTASLGPCSPAAAAACWSASSSPAATARLPADRMTPAPFVMIRWIAVRDSAVSSATVPAPVGSATGVCRAEAPEPTRGAPVAPVMSAAMRSAKTRPSRRELDASRFAPCTPVQATSPQAYRPGTVVRPRRSVRTPPEA